MRARAGVRRGFSRLSDRAGGAFVAPTRVIDWIVLTNNNVNSDLTQSVSIPVGTLMVEVVATGGGGSTDGSSYNGGGGGGSVEYRFAPQAEGLTIACLLDRASGYKGAAGPSNATVTLPSGLGTITATGGTRAIGANGSSGGSGSGPLGSIVRSGGYAIPQGAGAGQGPFGGRPGPGASGGAAGPYGGNGGIDEQGGGARADYGSTSLSGFISLKFYGAPLS